MVINKKKAVILYLLICLIIVFISLIVGFFLNIYEPLITLSICSFCSLITLLINFYSGKNRENTNLFVVLLISFVRFLIIAGGLIISAVIIYFYKNNGDDYSFLYLLLGLIPIFISNLMFYLGSKND